MVTLSACTQVSPRSMSGGSFFIRHGLLAWGRGVTALLFVWCDLLGRSIEEVGILVAKRRSLFGLWFVALLLALTACGGGVAPIPATAPTAPTAAVAATTQTPPAAARLVTATTSPVNAATATRTGVAATVARPASPVSTPRAAATPARTAYPLTIQDIAGRRVTLTKRPGRIVSLAPSSTETLFAQGLGDRLVGVDQSSNFPAAALDKPKIGTFSQPSIEQIVALAPDLVLAANLHLRSAVPALESRGVIVVVLNPVDLPAVLDSISLVGQLTDNASGAEQLRGEMEARIAAVEGRLRGVTARPRAYVEITAKFSAAGPASYIGDLVVRAGGANIVDDRSAQYPTLGAETIIARDPEVIILTDAGPDVTSATVAARAGWGTIAAVKAGRIVAVDSEVVNRAGPRVVEALEALAKAFHPELFR